MADRVPLPAHIITKAARLMSKQSADGCDVDREDDWRTYGQQYMQDAAEILAAVAPDIAAHARKAALIEAADWIDSRPKKDDEPGPWSRELSLSEMADALRERAK